MIHAEERSCNTQFELGEMFRHDQEAQDYRAAAQWFLRSARQGHCMAQYKIGLMYAHGIGVTQDYVKAYAWLKLAAIQGSTRARRCLQKVAGLIPERDTRLARSLTQCYFRDYVTPFA